MTAEPPEQPQERARLRSWMESTQEEMKRADPRMSWDRIAQLAGVSGETLRRVRTGTADILPTTRLGIERALRWREGSVTAILSGGAPIPEEPVTGPPGVGQSPPTPSASPPASGQSVWITMPGSLPAAMPIPWRRTPGLENLTEDERAPLLAGMLDAMMQAGLDYLYAEGQKRLGS